MRNLHKIALICFLPIFTWAQTLFFSEYIEGTSNNKALEIYNPTGSSIDLTAGNYVFQVYSNGASTPNSTTALSGTLDPGKTYVVANTSFALTVPSGTIQQTSNNVNYNGDDAVVLRMGGASGTILDVIGQIGFRPTSPSAWVGANGTSTLDMTLIRNPDIINGDLNGSDVFDLAAQWTGLATNNVTNLGMHTTASSTSVSVSSSNLIFSTSGVGQPSIVKSYIVKSTNATASLLISVGTDFEISLSESGLFNDTIILTNTQANTGDTIFVHYLPTTLGNHKDTIKHEVNGKSALVQVTGSIIDSITKIGTVQGSGGKSPVLGQKVAIIGVVTMDLQKTEEQKGFYMQAKSDNNPLTSDGIFVYDNLGSIDVERGNLIRVEGTVAEAFGQTELTSITSISPISSLVAITLDTVDVILPADTSFLERYEGMLARFPQKMVVTETYNLGRYGELPMSVNNRLYNPTELIDVNDVDSTGNTFSGTSNLQAVLDRQALNDKSRVVLCDYLSIQNPNPVPFVDPTTKTIRSGSSIVGMFGVLGYGFGAYRLYPDSINPPFNYAPRPSAPMIPSANVLVSGMNVLNFFNGDGQGGGFPTSRGAATLREHSRQKAKIVNVIKSLDADVFALMEMENDATTAHPALIDLVDSLNTAYGTATYTYVVEPQAIYGNSGTDEIKVAMIYKMAKVSPVGTARYKNDIAFEGLGRPPLAQTFKHIATNEVFTVIANHFKSKGCGTLIDANSDQFDGQGCFNHQRKLQAEALTVFIDSIIKISGDSDIVTLGDYNAYSQEDPMDLLRYKGLVDVTENIYSYVFSGQTGSLDHALVSKSMKRQMVAATKWHNNADEPTAIDYTLTFKTHDLYQPVPYRSSDHDPVLIGLDLKGVITATKDHSLIDGNILYPNPIEGGKLYSTNEISGEIIDGTGHAVLKFVNQKEIGIEQLSSGFYVLKTTNGEIGKLIVR